MNPTADPGAVIVALAILVVCAGGLIAAVFWSVPFALGRLRDHRGSPSGSPPRLFAAYQLAIALLGTAYLLCFCLAAGVALLVEEQAARALAIRAALLLAAVFGAAQVVCVPVAQRAIEAASEADKAGEEDEDAPPRDRA